MNWVDELYHQAWFKKLPDKEKKEILLSQHIDGPVPILRETTSMADNSDTQILMMSESIRAHDQQINTLLGVLSGPTGNGGIVADIKDIKNLVSAMSESFHALDKSQGILESDNKAAHEKMLADIDGVGRKAQRAIEISECTKAQLTEYITAELKEDKDELTDEKKTDRDHKFQWYHGVGIGTALIVLEVVVQVVIGG